ncbi:MAG: hypothetical protein EBT13_11460 [Rhodobacteraceae bacterium]|nr:hypothetical protein [Paracoccaceae bacterium]
MQEDPKAYTQHLLLEFPIHSNLVLQTIYTFGQNKDRTIYLSCIRHHMGKVAMYHLQSAHPKIC